MATVQRVGRSFYKIIKNLGWNFQNHISCLKTCLCLSENYPCCQMLEAAKWLNLTGSMANNLPRFLLQDDLKGNRDNHYFHKTWRHRCDIQSFNLFDLYTSNAQIQLRYTIIYINTPTVEGLLSRRTNMSIQRRLQLEQAFRNHRITWRKYLRSQ